MEVGFIQKVRKKMNKKIVRIIFWGLLSYGILIGIFYTEKKDYTSWNTVLSMVIAYTVEFGVIACNDLLDNSTWKEQLRLYMRKQIIKKDTPIRISFAYLFRIKIDGKYLLVLNGRGTGKYQPVGGAYKTTEKEKIFLKEKFFLAEDEKIPVDISSKNDYRMFVPANRLKAFVRRFDKTKDREFVDNLKREFCEELIDTGILDFEKISYRYCGRHFTPIEFSRHFQCYELLLADVVELIPTKEQEEKLRKLMTNTDKKYCFASADEIKHCGIVQGTDKLKEIIGDHSLKILEETEKDLKKIIRNRGIYSVDLK